MPQIVALNKMDLAEARERLQPCEKHLAARGHTCLPISAATRTGLPELVAAVAAELDRAGPPPIEAIKQELEDIEIEKEYLERQKQGKRRKRLRGSVSDK